VHGVKQLVNLRACQPEVSRLGAEPILDRPLGHTPGVVLKLRCLSLQACEFLLRRDRVTGMAAFRFSPPLGKPLSAVIELGSESLDL
jgi:hypothetical protein